MKRCFIYAAGTFYGLREPPRGGDLQIAADAGLLLCERLGVRPDVVLGDFDSMDVRQAPADCIRVPVEKDDTDTMLALREGLRRGCDTFYLYGATGGARLDHTLANLQSLAFLLRHGARGYLYDQNFVYTAIENETLTLTREVEWGIVSLFSMGDRRRAHHARGAAISAHGRDDRLRLPARREQPHRCADGAHYGGARTAARRLGAAKIGRGGVKFSHGERQSRSVGWHSL